MRPPIGYHSGAIVTVWPTTCKSRQHSASRLSCLNDVLPPWRYIRSIACRAQSAAFLRVAALAPRIVVAESRASPVGQGLVRLDVRVENHGYLPTHILSSAKKLEWNEPLVAEALAHGCELANPREARQEVGHLDGWGRGRFSGEGALYHLQSRGSTGAKTRHSSVMPISSARSEKRGGQKRRWIGEEAGRADIQAS